MKNRAALLLLTASLVVACQTQTTDNNFISIKDARFVDAQSRTIILNGVNHVNKNRNDGYVCADDSTTFRKFRDWGFNCIRYGIIWDGLEPEPGVIDTTYLQEIDKRVRWAADNDIYLLLDMHQDLYSRQWADGAPDWATISDGQPHLTGAVWSDSYMISPALHAAFDNFWNNTKATDSIGIQDHYVNLWRVIAKRYADSPSVIGFDIMNEPFMGSASQNVSLKLMEGFASTLAPHGIKIESAEDLNTMWGNPEQRAKALSLIDDKEQFRTVTSGAADIVAQFEQGPLSTLYQKAHDAIRSVNQRHIIFLEHNYYGNLGVPAAFKIPTNSHGVRDSLCAYAPHAYDLVTDTGEASEPSYGRLDVIFEEIVRFGAAQKLPILLGEWGAYYLGQKAIKPASYQARTIEHNLMGQTYWAYWSEIETQDYFKSALSRTYPMATNGKLINYTNNNDTSSFSMEWSESQDSKSPTIIYITDTSKAKIEIEPTSEFTITPYKGSTSGLLKITPNGQQRKLNINFN